MKMTQTAYGVKGSKSRPARIYTAKLNSGKTKNFFFNKPTLRQDHKKATPGNIPLQKQSGRITKNSSAWPGRYNVTLDDGTEHQYISRDCTVSCSTFFCYC